MSFEVQIGTVNKRLNSTYQPSTELIHTIDVVLKESCSDYTPTFILKNPSNTFPYNYLKWGNWYYYITNVIRDKNQLVTITCTLDELATFKSNIVNSVQFVAYDGTANTEIIDGRLSVNTSSIVSKSVDSSGSLFETGSIILGAVGKQNTGMFALSISQMRNVINSIFTNYLDQNDMLPVPLGGFSFTNIQDSWNALITNITIAVRQMIATGKAPDSIKSCIFVACPADKFSGSNANIWLGNFDTDVSGKLLDPTSRAVETHTLSIPWNFTDWRKNTPYTYIYLKLPYVGLIPIPSSQIISATTLNITTFVTQNGDVSHLVYASGGTEQIYIGRFGGNCACNVLIGASGDNPVAQLVGGLTVGGAGIGSAMFATTTAGQIAMGSAAIAGFLGAINPLSATAGAGGGGAFTDDAIFACYCVSHNTNVEPSSVSAFMGTPTMAVKSLAGLTGYVECKNASVAIDASNDTIARVNNALNGGVYIE